MRGLLKKLIMWAIAPKEEERTNTANYGPEAPYSQRDKTDVEHLREQHLELNNKFMELCSHLGVYVSRTAPQKMYEIRKLDDLKVVQGLSGASTTGLNLAAKPSKSKEWKV